MHGLFRVLDLDLVLGARLPTRDLTTQRSLAQIVPGAGVYPAASFDTFEVNCNFIVVRSNTQDDSGRDPALPICCPGVYSAGSGGTSNGASRETRQVAAFFDAFT